VHRVVVLGVDAACLSIGEPPVDNASCLAPVVRRVPEQRPGQPGLHQDLAQFGDDLRRRVIEAIEHPHHPRADVVGTQPHRRIVTRQAKQIITLVEGEAKAASDCHQHLVRGFALDARFSIT